MRAKFSRWIPAATVLLLLTGTALAISAGPTLAAGNLPVIGVVASGDDGTNGAQQAVDGDLSTRWSGPGDGAWIRFDLGSSTTVQSVRIAWYHGDERVSTFDVQTSDDATAWNTVFAGQSSGATAGYEDYDVTDRAARYVRIVGHGNTVNDWTSISEVQLIGAAQTWESTADSAAAFPTGMHGIGSGNGGTVQVEFDLTPAAAPINGVIGYADTSTPVTEYADFAVAIRLASGGYFDARDGVNYSRTSTVSYLAGRTYRVRVVADVPGRSYSVDITAPGGSPVRIANGFTFRHDSPDTDELGQVGLKSDAAGQFRVDNHSVTVLNRPDGIPAATRTVPVSSLSGLTTALANARPGDHIVLANNTYTTSGRITLRARGTFDAPVVVTAASVGGVTIAGDGGFVVQGSSYLVIRGFVFRHGTESGIGMEVETSDHVRVSRNHFVLRNGSSAKWLQVDGGSKVRIDHNRFDNKTTESSLLLIDPGSDGALATYSVIDHNYFRAVTTPNDDTGEALRIGFSGAQNQSGYAVVQHNLFEDCDGDAEVISNKSSDNVYRHNTFRSNRGSLVLRHGDRARVEGNYFLDNNGGFRMYGDNHSVLGNYFAGNTGSRTSVLATFVIGSGDTAADGSDTDGAGYDQPNGGFIAFNTLTANSSHFVIGRGSDHPLPARNLRFGNNIAAGSSGDLVYYYGNAPQNFTWEGNILYGTSRGDIPTGYRLVDPQLATGADGIRRLTSGSPARDSAASSSFYATLNTDLDGQPRAEPKDVGADEYSTASIPRHPLQPGDVGPGAA